ncbi:HlyD family efflux transporter periplasmic adaptor subunit [Rhodoferax ferrireducens]|uniref:HlyD family secretion protein n=1 Tax=Rhodoferax ferrireducens TaxID=192843 RepID=UPI00298D680E|nr:HlyD family efflux transporter periplasmic adaptor subunit [Rhodoferax ferrireducens]WPC67836.1 HlyD family efflux transporter periplasmic adaptor subunit [Rhodoferax ferrireducens]
MTLVLLAAVWRTQLLALLKAKDEANVLSLSGNIEAHESVLGFKTVQSRIVELPFHEGQWVSKGTVLAVVDDADYRQQMAIAESNLAVQKQQLEAARQNLYTAERTLLVDQAEVRQRQLDQQRALDLQQQGFTSKATLDQADTALKQASAVLQRDQSLQTAAARAIDVAKASVLSGEAAVALARIVLSYTTLRAPFDGVVNVQQAEVGEIVVPGTPVLTLADLDHVWLRAYLNESDLGRVRMGQEVSVSNDSDPNRRYQGRISFISEKAEFTPKSVETHAERVNLVYRIKIDIANPEHELVPGMPADARIALHTAGS